MAHQDLRQWNFPLEEKALLARIRCRVNWDRVIEAMSRKILNRKGPAFLFLMTIVSLAIMKECFHGNTD